MSLTEPFRRWYPIAFEKASDGRIKVKGIISTEHEDRQGDTIEQDGLNFRPFLRYGWLNDNHSKDTTGVLGYPDKVYPTAIPEKGKRVKAWAMEATLLDTPEARRVAALAEQLAGTPRQLGFSVEGPPPKRDPANPKRIVEAEVWNVAVTNCPVNPYTSLGLVKSMDAVQKALSVGGAIGAEPGVAIAGSARPLMPQSMGGLVRLTLNPDGRDTARRQADLTKEWLAANGHQLAKGLAEMLRALRSPERPALAAVGGSR